MGIIVCHNGTIYKYRVGERIPCACYDVVVAKYLKRGYNNYEAQIRAIEDMKERYKIEFEEVEENGV